MSTNTRGRTRRSPIRLLVASVLLALVTGLVVIAPNPAAADDRPSPPEFLQVGLTSGGYVSVVWHVDHSLDAVNVYRDGDYITTVSGGGNVYNDFSGQRGSKYNLVAVRDGKFSSMSRSIWAGGEPGRTFVGADILVRPTGAEVKIRWQGQGGINGYRIYRLDSGGEVSTAHMATYLGYARSDQRSGSYVDPNPVEGASYGIVKVRTDGTLLPIFTIRPDYTKPVHVPAHIDADVSVHYGTTTLTWDAPAGVAVTDYVVTKLQAETGRYIGSRVTTDRVAMVDNRGRASDLYVVTARNADGVVATSGIFVADGRCEEMCSQAQADVTYVEGGQYYHTPPTSNLPSIESQALDPVADFVPVPQRTALDWLVELAMQLNAEQIAELLDEPPLPDPTHGQTTITHDNQVVQINATTGVVTTTTFVPTPDGPITVQTVSTPSATRPVAAPGTEPGVVQQAVPNSPMTNETTVTMPNGSVHTATTVTSPTGGTYSASSPGTTDDSDYEDPWDDLEPTSPDGEDCSGHGSCA